MNGIYKRGLHLTEKGEVNPLKQSLLNPNRLGELVDLVKQDQNLTLEIRNNYINIYYQGGNVAKISSDKSVDVNKNYFRQHKKKDEEDWSYIEDEVKKVKELFKKGEYQKYVEKVQAAMHKYWSVVLDNKGIDEKKTQHQICLYNSSSSDSDYIVVDVEYEVSTESMFHYVGPRVKTDNGKISRPKPRFDIIAIRKSDHRLCVIELKKGLDALKGKSGLVEHAESYRYSVGKTEETRKLFVDEIRGIIEVKKELGLLSDDVYIDGDAPEYIFAYQFDDTRDRDEQKKEFDKIKCEKKDFGNKVPRAYAKDVEVIWLDENDFSLKSK